MFEEFKKERDEEDKEKRNKAFAIKERRKKGKYMRGEKDFSSSYAIKPWGDETTKTEENKRKKIEERKKEVAEENKKKRKRIDDEIDVEKKKDLEKRYFEEKVDEYEKPDDVYEKFE
jgi:hypothetical protein